MKPVFAAGAFALALAASPVAAQHEGHMPAGPAAPPVQEEHEGHDMPMPQENAAPHQAHGMTGALGPYAMSREASGTAWQPDASPHEGLHLMAGDWTLMGHARIAGVYDWQEGPRGDEKGFVSGMVMGMARRPLGPGTLQLRASLSPDALMGRRGYPLLLAAGETANGA